MEAHDIVVGENNIAVVVPLSVERVAEEAEKESTYIAEFPMNDWLRKIAKTDSGMPRYLEDLITTNSLTMTSEMKVRYDKKIKIRGERP